jgi:hypothetical protein
MAALRKATADRGMSLHAWIVFTHNTLLGSRHPEAVAENVFGDPQPTGLCPANPAVVDYCRALARDVARYDVDSILAESLHYDVLEHGYHHERYLLTIGPIDRLLLGLCFCVYCRARGADAGVDSSRLAEAVRHRLDRLFETASAYDAAEASLDALSRLWDGELVAYLHARERAVCDLAAEVMDALAPSDVPLAVIDPAGAFKGYADGDPSGGPATDESWRFGVDPVGLSRSCDELVAVAYASDPERVRADLESYRALTSGRCRLRAALRPMAPDCSGVANLAAKLTALDESEVSRVDFYHYGFLRLEDLDIVRAALSKRGVSWRQTR